MLIRFFAVLFCALPAFAWHDLGHMIVSQIAYLRLSPAARAKVDRLLAPPQPGRRALIRFPGRTYDPVTIGTWMDDFREDSLNDSYAPWHYSNHKPLFDGIPPRPGVGPAPVNILDRLHWAINTLRAGAGSDQKEAETLGFLYHLAGDIHQPLHAATRYSAADPDGDSGGNGFAVQMPAETGVRNLHSFWDAAAGLFGFDRVRRDGEGLARVRDLAEKLMREHPPESLATEPFEWLEESNTLARTFAYVKTRPGERPSEAYTAEAQRISARRLALAGYRLAAVLNGLYQ